MSKTLQEFMNTFDPDGTLVVLDLDVAEARERLGASPFIVIRFEGRVMVLNPMALTDHLCVDAHAFIDGENARTGAFGMEETLRGRLEFDKDKAKGTSHGWAAAKLVALLLGDQKDAPQCPICKDTGYVPAPTPTDADSVDRCPHLDAS